MIIGILGAGKLGVTLAQLATKAVHTVYVAGSGSPEKIRLSMNVLAPQSVPVSSEEAIAAAELLILALPLSKLSSLSAADFAGKLVIDAMNYWWEVDGELPELTQYNSSSEMVQSHLPSARIVKAISHIGYHHLHDESRRDSDSSRKAIAIAGDNELDVQKVSEFVTSLGFTPLPIGNLANGKKLEPGHAAFGANLSKEELAQLLS